MIKNFNMIKFSHCGRKTSVGVIQKKFLHVKDSSSAWLREPDNKPKNWPLYVLRDQNFFVPDLGLPSPPVGLPFLVSVNFGKLICVCGH